MTVHLKHPGVSQNDPWKSMADRVTLCWQYFLTQVAHTENPQLVTCKKCIKVMAKRREKA